MLPDDLLRPEAWPAPRPRAIERIETHVSWVLRAEGEVLKLKKPVDLGFVDFRSPERRRAACEDEVRLNSRLAPGTYLGVVPVVERGDGTLGLGGGGRVVDWAVRMERLDDDARADTMLARGALTVAHLDAVAEAIAGFHAGAAVPQDAAARWGSREAVERNVRDNFEQTAFAVPDRVDAATAREVERAQRAFLDRHGALFAARVASGRVRDGHGDLRLEHVYFDRGLRIIDCVEFDERYRVADACADVAFLSMDLAAHDRVDLGERFLARYARAADDHDLYALVDFYEGYRAWVRGKVAAMLAEDAGAPDETRRRAAAEARRHFLLALACTRKPVVEPMLVCVGGTIASGKSTIADALSDGLACPVVDADRTRKRMLGVETTTALDEAPWRGAYDLGFTERVYDEVLRRASVVLASNRWVIVDASFRSRAMRERARRIARERGLRVLFVECRCPAEVCRARLVRREHERGVSDGRLAIFDDFSASFEPMTELAPEEHVAVDTTRPNEVVLSALRGRIG